MLHPHLALDDAFVGRFRHEARAVAALRHPNIVQVFDFGVDDGAYYMVMEFIDGGTLAALLRDAKRQAKALPPEDVLRLFVPLCSAIDYAAGQGMVHRDIKPSNIMLTKADDPILTGLRHRQDAGRHLVHRFGQWSWGVPTIWHRNRPKGWTPTSGPTSTPLELCSSRL